MKKSSRVIGVVIAVLLIGVVAVWYVTTKNGAGVLRVSFLDVGEGDAVLIQSPSGTRVLIDGGPDDSVLRQLGGTLLPWDRRIDAVIATHPDKDHIMGLIEVLARYKVSLVVQSSVQGATPEWEALQKEVVRAAEGGAHIDTALRGQVLDLGGGAYLEILSPDRAVPHVDTNVGCVVTRLTFGDTAFLFPCDAPQAIEKYLAALDGARLHADVLKAGHHGSKTSSSPFFVSAVDPSFVVYSRGCDNSYGFPNKETIATFAQLGVETADTCTDGTVTFVSDGVVARKE